MATGSLYFNGIDTWAYHDSGPDQTDWFLSPTYTIEFYSNAANSTYSGGPLYTIMCQDPNNDSIDIFYNNGNLNILNGDSYCPEPVPNIWTHIAIVSNTGSLSIYYNGISVPVTGSSGGHPSSHAKLAIGRRGYTLDDQYFSGSLTDIRITKNIARYSSSFEPCDIDITDINSNVVLAMPAYNTNPLLDISQYNHEFINNGITWKYGERCLPSVCVATLLGGLYEKFPLGQDFANATRVYSEQDGEYFLLTCTQKFYSFDYYAVYPPLTIRNSTYYYVAYNGFTASFDPRTEIILNKDGGLECNEHLLKAIYRY